MTGLFPQTLNQLKSALQPKIRTSIRCLLSPLLLLIHFLFYLRHHPKLKVIASLFQISESTSCRFIHWMMPHVYEVCAKLSTMEWPRGPIWSNVPFGFVGTQFLIDCTSHPRRRIHPGQHLYYRGDKGFHFLTAQVIVDVYGKPLHVAIGRGHNNDQGMFKLSGKKRQIQMDNVLGLSDRGYSNVHLIRPDDIEFATRLHLSVDAFGCIQSKHRASAEIINSLSKFYSFASTRVAQVPEFQAYALMIIYYLVGMIMEHSPTWFKV